MDEQDLNKKNALEAIRTQMLQKAASKTPLDLSNPIDKMVYGHKTVASDENERIMRDIEAAADYPTSADLIQAYGEQAGGQMAERLRAEQQGTPFQKERFRNLTELVLKRKYPKPSQ